MGGRSPIRSEKLGIDMPSAAAKFNLSGSAGRHNVGRLIPNS